MSKPTHGHTIGYKQSRTFMAWMNMRARCTRPSFRQYADYGGRGIKVCKRWRRFEAFLADMGEAPEGKTLDRIDNNGNYTPKNCRWATRAEQHRNTRRNRFIVFNGVRLCLKDWSRKIGVDPMTLHYRLKVGWPLHRALTTPGRV